MYSQPMENVYSHDSIRSSVRNEGVPGGKTAVKASGVSDWKRTVLPVSKACVRRCSRISNVRGYTYSSKEGRILPAISSPSRRQ